MRLSNPACTFVFLPALLFGQGTWNTVTVTATRAANLQPDQINFGVTVGSGIDQGLDDVVKALAGSGITAANLIGINVGNLAGTISQTIPPAAAVPQPAPLSWYFQIAVPVAKVKETSTSLAALQQSITQKNPALSLSFSLQGVAFSTPQAPNCDFNGLIADARAQAQKLAGAANFTPGAIVALTSSVAQGAPGCFLTARFALGTTLVPQGPNAITILASRNSSAPPDQVRITLNVSSGVTIGVDEVSAALAAAGINGATLSGVGPGPFFVTNGPNARSDVNWSFSLIVPLSKLKDTLAQLAAAPRAITKQNPNLTLTFYVAGVQPSAQPACPQADLVADTKAQAQKIASAAGASLGGILTIADGGGVGGIGVPASIRSGSFLAVAGSYSSFLLTSPVTGCSVSVQFQML